MYGYNAAMATYQGSGMQGSGGSKSGTKYSKDMKASGGGDATPWGAIAARMRAIGTGFVTYQFTRQATRSMVHDTALQAGQIMTAAKDQVAAMGRETDSLLGTQKAAYGMASGGGLTEKAVADRTLEENFFESELILSGAKRTADAMMKAARREGHVARSAALKKAYLSAF
jgi:hypothetical protein